MTHIMVDIETHSTQTFAAIASIAAAAFPLEGGKITSAFSVNIEPSSCEEIGLHFDPKVAEWWLKQSQEAQDSFKDNQLPVKEALRLFKDWFHRSGGKYAWSQGASFDIPILANAYAMSGVNTPWNFMNIRDTRTIYAISDFDVSSVQRNDKLKHDAAADVLFQIKCVQGAYRKIKNG
jgi:3' exoribonuclease, RNase T-like